MKYIQLIQKQDLEKMRKIRNSKFVNKFTRDDSYISKRKQEEWHCSLLNNNKIFYFSIFYKGDIVGSCNLSKKYVKDQIAEFGIYLDKSSCGKGIGKRAMKELIDYGFSSLHLKKIFGEVFTFNINAIKLYLSLGFQIEAALKNHIYKDNKNHDIYIVSLFKEAK